MKGGRMLAVLAVLLLVSPVLSGEKTCYSKNPFLGSIKNSRPISVGILDNPKKGAFSHCQSEWNIYGTCCQESHLLEFFELESGIIDNTRKALDWTVHHLKEVLEDISSFLKKEKNANKQFQTQVNQLLNIPELPSFNQTSENCWSYFKKIRGSALCATCSGRSEKFFFNNKILVSPEDCSDTVRVCEGFFKTLREVESALEPIRFDIDNHIQRVSWRKAIKRIYRSMLAYKPPKQLMDAFLNFESKKAATKQVELEAAKVCSMIMNLRKPPYILNYDGSIAELFKGKIGESIKSRTSTYIQHQRNKIQKEIQEFSKLKDEKLELAHNTYLSELSRARNQEVKKAAKARYDARLAELNIALKNKQEFLLAKLRGLEAQVNEHKQKVQEYWNSYIKDKHSNWINKNKKEDFSESRELNNLPTEETLLLKQAQSRVLESDSSVLIPASFFDHDSIVVTQGITVDNGSLNRLAMNMSLTFP